MIFDVLTIIFLSGFFLIIVALVMRISYKIFLPYKNIKIKDVSCIEDKKGNLLNLRCCLAFMVGGRRQFKCISKTMRYLTSDGGDFKNKIELLKGVEIRYYYFPFILSVGYLDNKLLLLPVWVYVVVFLVYLLMIVVAVLVL